MINETDKLIEFFAVVPPGLEELAKEELEEKFQLHFQLFPSNITITKGGISFYALEPHGVSLNWILKTPTRLLRRLVDFKCRDFPKLFQKLKKIPWNDYLACEQVSFKASARKSRLINSDKIVQTAEKAFTAYRKGNPLKQKLALKAQEFPEATVYLSLKDDVCQISLDTTGERLNIRKERVNISKAPLRENIASALLRFCSSEDQNLRLLDPMAGSGVFLIENFNHYQINKRDFAFMAWPQYLKNPLPKPVVIDKELFSTVWGNEMDSHVFKALKENLSPLADKESSRVHLSESDYQKVRLPDSDQYQLICNLPYGMRIKVGNLKDFYSTFCKWCMEQKPVKSLGLLFPMQWQSFMQKQLAGIFEVEKKLSFKNGGIDVVFLVFKRVDDHQSKP